MDFILERVDRGEDEKEGEIALRITPDPRRYTLIESEDGHFYLDKYLRHRIDVSAMNEAMIQQMDQLPLYNLSPSMDDAPTYAGVRRLAATAELTSGIHQPPTEKAKRHHSFEANLEPRDAVFLSVDIVGSSSDRRSNPAAFETRYKLLVKELGIVVGLFQGAIHKLTGDGFIAVIDFPAFTLQCDNAVDLGLSLLRVLHDTVNPALADHHLSPLAIRIGADFGAAEFRVVEIPSTDYRQVEIASDALNRAVKIDQSCEPNEFRIGRTLYEILHVKWLERAEEVPFDGQAIGWPGYLTYRMR